MNKKEISVLSALILTFVVSLLSGQIYEAETVTNNTLRMHIIANSNSQKDQSDKLYVRDKILEMDDIMPTAEDNYEKSVDKISDNIPAIENRLNEILKEKDIPYNARCSVENFYFNTTQYSGFALPQGEYTALTVRLGKAEGKNWWCVMYPALCSQTFGEIALEDSSDFIKTDKLTPRFKVVEVYQNIKNVFVKNNAKQYENLK